MSCPTLDSLCRRLAVSAPAAPLSLAPSGGPATPLDRLLRRLEPGALAPPLAHALEGISQAIDRHFPGNLFADLDFLGAELLERGRRCGPDALNRNAGEIADLHALFGLHSPIRFRYVHDFLYGFDWARWVGRAPRQRGHTRPFDPEFIAHLRQRGRQLAARIRRGDQTYPRLGPGQTRNPFPFSREPSLEASLHRALARDGLLPVEAWDAAGACRWDLDSTRRRTERALSFEKQNLCREADTATGA